MPTHVFLGSGRYGLPRNSMVMLEQIRTIDKKRMLEYIGQLDSWHMNQVDAALMLSIDLGQVVNKKELPIPDSREMKMAMG